jgi:hypothetical protein
MPLEKAASSQVNSCPKSKSKLHYDQWSFGQYLLVSGTHLGPLTKFSSFFNYLYALRGCLCMAPSLMRGLACSLQLLVGLTNVVFLGSESRESWPHFIVSILRPLQPGGRFPAFISAVTRVAQTLDVNSCPINLANYNFSLRTARKHRSSIHPFLQAWLWQRLPRNYNYRVIVQQWLVL